MALIDNNLKQVDVAKKMGISQQLLHARINANNPTKAGMDSIAQAIGITTSQLLAYGE